MVKCYKCYGFFVCNNALCNKCGEGMYKDQYRYFYCAKNRYIIVYQEVEYSFEKDNKITIFNDYNDCNPKIKIYCFSQIFVRYKNFTDKFFKEELSIRNKINNLNKKIADKIKKTIKIPYGCIIKMDNINSNI